MSEATLKGEPSTTVLQGSDESGNGVIRILTVDDNDALRYSLGRFLREAGYHVIEASTGREALSLAKESPDLITLDINLPDMTGFQVCRELKADPTTASIPILHVSATFVDAESKVRGLESGADGYLAEPIDRAELVATVGALLRLKNAEAIARQQAESAERARKELERFNASLEERISARTAELKTANESLRELSARLLQMQDEDRRRIARELHDGVGQLLAAIAMNNSLISEEGTNLGSRAAKALENNESLVREVMRSIRTISYLLHPPLLDEAGLHSALRSYVEEFSARSGIHVDLDYPSDLERLPTELETAMFRIIQESLGNVHRHSSSRNAGISVALANGNICLKIRDNGVGISSAKQKEIGVTGKIGVGLRGMRERIAHLGGEFCIESGSTGTTVTAMIPLRAANSEEGEVA
jgi:signal transduction histidine kinase